PVFEAPLAREQAERAEGDELAHVVARAVPAKFRGGRLKPQPRTWRRPMTTIAMRSEDGRAAVRVVGAKSHLAARVVLGTQLVQLRADQTIRIASQDDPVA